MVTPGLPCSDFEAGAHLPSWRMAGEDDAEGVAFAQKLVEAETVRPLRTRPCFLSRGTCQGKVTTRLLLAPAARLCREQGRDPLRNKVRSAQDIGELSR